MSKAEALLVLLLEAGEITGASLVALERAEVPERVEAFETGTSKIVPQALQVTGPTIEPGKVN